MNPKDVSNRETDPLEELFKMPDPYIADGGFTDRVMANLPPPKAAYALLRGIILSVFTALALLVGFVIFPGLQILRYAFFEITNYRPVYDSISNIPLIAMLLVAIAIGLPLMLLADLDDR